MFNDFYICLFLLLKKTPISSTNPTHYSLLTDYHVPGLLWYPYPDTLIVMAWYFSGMKCWLVSLVYIHAGGSLLFVCISSKDAKCFLIRFNYVWLNNLLNMYFACNRHAMYLTQLFLFRIPSLLCQLCVPRKSRWCSVPWNVGGWLICQRSQKFDTSLCSACLCIVVPTGGPYASGALSAFVRVSRQQKNTYYCVFCGITSFLYFFCQINNFQVQVQVQAGGAEIPQMILYETKSNMELVYFGCLMALMFAVFC